MKSLSRIATLKSLNLRSCDNIRCTSSNIYPQEAYFGSKY